jgi:hypothetical protein
MGDEIMRSIVVLGTAHCLQGAMNSQRQRIDDPSYRRLVEQLISSYRYRVEIIFEEAAGCGPTDAQKIADQAQIRYMDVDPSPDERVRLGMRPKPPSEGGPIDERGLDCYSLDGVEMLEAQDQRENHWLREIKESDFSGGLLICGYMHTLSLAFRFRAAGFRVESLSYIPYHKLCPRMHADSLPTP